MMLSGDDVLGLAAPTSLLPNSLPFLHSPGAPRSTCSVSMSSSDIMLDLARFRPMSSYPTSPSPVTTVQRTPIGPRKTTTITPFRRASRQKLRHERALVTRANHGDLEAGLDLISLEVVESALAQRPCPLQPGTTLLAYLNDPGPGIAAHQAASSLLEFLADETNKNASDSVLIYRYIQAHALWRDAQVASADELLQRLTGADLVRLNLAAGTRTYVLKRQHIDVISERWGLNWFEEMADILNPAWTRVEDCSMGLLTAMVATSQWMSLSDALDRWRSQVAARTNPGRRGIRGTFVQHLLPADVAEVNRVGGPAASALVSPRIKELKVTLEPADPDPDADLNADREAPANAASGQRTALQKRISTPARPTRPRKRRATGGPTRRMSKRGSREAETADPSARASTDDTQAEERLTEHGRRRLSDQGANDASGGEEGAGRIDAAAERLSETLSEMDTQDRRLMDQALGGERDSPREPSEEVPETDQSLVSTAVSTPAPLLTVTPGGDAPNVDIIPSRNVEQTRSSATCGGRALTTALRDVVKIAYALKSGGDAIERCCEQCHTPSHEVTDVILERLAPLLRTLQEIEHYPSRTSSLPPPRLRNLTFSRGDSEEYGWDSGFA